MVAMSVANLAKRYPHRDVGRYRIYSELASGGMATVHLGCLLGSAGFSKLVAIKCLHQQFAAEPSFVAMFLDEARLASSINHPNVVASLDVVVEDGELLVVMEYVHGETLANLLRSSRLTNDAPRLPVVARAMCDALEGLHAAHVASQAGRCLNIVHRDVSPQNIMVGADGNTRVLDFGIAQAAMRSQVTAAGTIKGKLAYMSPEQIQGRAVDAGTDIFAAGVVLWEAITGRRLFYAADQREQVEMVLTAPIPAPSSIVAGLPPALDGVVLKALERERGARYETAHDFAEALRKAVGEGSRGQVADWVRRAAKDSLARRLEQLQALEASAIHTQASMQLPAISGSSPLAATSPLFDGTQTSATVTSATVTRSMAPLQSPEPTWRDRIPWLVAAFGMLAAVLALLISRSEANAPTVPSPIASVAAAQRPSATERAVAAVAARADGVPEVSIDGIPLASAEPVKRVPLKKSTTPVAAATTTGAATRAKSCNPPYRIDAAGVRRVKPECL
jgi:serine/threonine protein kinase